MASPNEFRQAEFRVYVTIAQNKTLIYRAISKFLEERDIAFHFVAVKTQCIAQLIYLSAY